MSDFTALAELGRLADNLEALARVPSRASAEAAETIAQRIDEQFDAGCDPYGNAWEPLKSGDASHLEESSDLRGSVDVSPMQGAGIAITVSDPKAIFHQRGTSRMPARPILPEGGMPPTWEAAIGDACDSAFHRTLGGG